ncbi:M48 family metallopeptidase [Nitratidesulfovibrio sp. 1201_IL3209]|uniref:M48 family metallopeptidase n=1 Tax=Nitratidesulfovibrio sp. 1201_IL3209 TaxID=3084053 RepID=UPI002FDA9788
MTVFRGRMQWGPGVAPLLAVALASLLLVPALSGCGRKAVSPAPVVEARKEHCPQPPASVERRMCQRERLWNVGYALRESNAPLCGGRTVLDDGVVVVSTDTLDDMLSPVRWGDLGAFVEMRRWRDAYAREYGLDARHRVISVLRGSGGEEAGIRPGDVLVAVNGQPMPSGKLAARTLRWQVTKALGAGDTVTYTVDRNGLRMDVPVRFHRVCDTIMDVEVRDTVDASSTGQSIHVTIGLLERFSDDADLAAVLGREMARHIRQTGQTGPIGQTGGGAASSGTGKPGVRGYYGMPPAGGLVKPEAAEADRQTGGHDIDRLALFCMARAGYDHRRAGPMFEAMAELPLSRRSVLHGEIVPAGVDARARSARLALAVAEIDGRLAAGQPLTP